MLISYKRYNWHNTITGKEPVTGDEFLYAFFSNKDEPAKKYLCMNPAIHPIKKHPVGFAGAICVLPIIFGGNALFDFTVIPTVILGVSVISGAMFSFLIYLPYYKKERAWKQQVLRDWKEDRLRYKYSETLLSDFNNQAISEELFS